MPTASKNSGVTEIIIAGGIVMVLGMVSLSLSFSARLRNLKAVQRIDRMESFYSTELAAWHGYERLRQDSDTDSEKKIVAINSHYVADIDLVPDAYSAGRGVALNVATTRQFCPPTGIIRRLAFDTLTYRAPTQNNFCGAVSLGGKKKSYSGCLAGGSKVPVGCDIMPVKPSSMPPNCNSLMTVLPPARLLPVTWISNQAELLSITSNGNYKLKNNIVLDMNFKPVGGGDLSPSFPALSNIVFDGNGFTISNLRYTPVIESERDSGLFTSLAGSIVRDVIIDSAELQYAGDVYQETIGALVGRVAGESCIENVSINSGWIKANSIGGGIIGRVENAAGGVQVFLIQSRSNVDLKATGAASGGVLGGLVGSVAFSYGGLHVLYSCASGKVEGGTGMSSDFIAGGLVGDFGGEILRSAYVGGRVTGTKAGGIAGCVQGALTGGARIEASFAKTNVVARLVGGLIGAVLRGDATITDSFSVGSVTADNTGDRGNDCAAGGMFPLLQDEDGYQSKIRNSLSTAKVSHQCTFDPAMPSNRAKLGGLVTIADNAWVTGTGDDSEWIVIRDSYWDAQAVGVTSADGAGGRPLSTAQAQTASSYANWDFTNTWKIEPGAYPTLRWIR